MGYYGTPGSYRSTIQGMLSPSNTSYRVYNVHYVLTSTATPANTTLYVCDVIGTATTTASPNTNIYLTVVYDSSIPSGVADYRSFEGIFFPNGIFIQTPSSLAYYTISYSAVAPR